MTLNILAVAMLAGMCTAVWAQAESAWMRFDPAEEYHGLSYDSRAETESRVQYIEVEKRWWIATERDAGQYYIDLVPDVDAIPPGLDVLSVTIEYLDNGTGPIVLQYRSTGQARTGPDRPPPSRRHGGGSAPPGVHGGRGPGRRRRVAERGLRQRHGRPLGHDLPHTRRR